MWFTRPFVLLAEKVGLRAAAGTAARAEAGVASAAVNVEAKVAAEAATGAAKAVEAGAKTTAGIGTKVKNFFGFGGTAAAAEGGMSFVGKAAGSFMEKGFWGKAKDVALIGIAVVAIYKIGQWLFGGKDKEDVSPQAQAMNAPVVAPLQPAMGMAPQVQWGQAAGASAGMTYTAGVGDAQLMQQQMMAQPQTSWQHRVGGHRAVRGSHVEQYQAQQAAAAMQGQYVGA